MQKDLINSANCAFTSAGEVRGLIRTSKKISVAAEGKAGRSGQPERNAEIHPSGLTTPEVFLCVYS
ncbi:MAG: hypothetical protein CM15mP125_0670 [Gammaproteobacteria bacterium]|nr:MAG: hypothetical protein CM15mP125_0670 [Gammaproteobacteria bacterium]